MAYLTDEELAALDPVTVANDGDVVAEDAYDREQLETRLSEIGYLRYRISEDCLDLRNWAYDSINIELLEEVRIQLRKIIAKTYTC